MPPSSRSNPMHSIIRPTPTKMLRLQLLLLHVRLLLMHLLLLRRRRPQQRHQLHGVPVPLRPHLVAQLHQPLPLATGRLQLPTHTHQLLPQPFQLLHTARTTCSLPSTPILASRRGRNSPGRWHCLAAAGGGGGGGRCHGSVRCPGGGVPQQLPPQGAVSDSQVPHTASQVGQLGGGRSGGGGVGGGRATGCRQLALQ